MKKKQRKLVFHKENVVKLNSIFGGALPTTGQSTVRDETKKGEVCEITQAICPTNWFDC